MKSPWRFFLILIVVLLAFGCSSLAGAQERAKPRNQDRGYAQPRERMHRDHDRYRWRNYDRRAPRHHYREQRHYRQYRPSYRYYWPYRHYRFPQYSYNCRVWMSGYWAIAHDGYEFWVPGHYGYVLCR